MSFQLKFVLALSTLALAACGGGEEDFTVSNPISVPTAYFAWMTADIKEAWRAGFYGQGTQVIVVNDFTSDQTLRGNLGLEVNEQTHGAWVAQHVEMLAPAADIDRRDYAFDVAVPLASGKLNVINLSYSIPDNLGPDATINWGAREASIISYANGAAVVVKSAGNEGVAVGAPSNGSYDYLNRDLIEKPTAIFAGALSSHGSVSAPASIASYSNIAGTDTRVQSQFLVVGVTGDTLARGGTGLEGTSFAAPQISSYAAVLGSKFTNATATQITNQLLKTARTDTIRGYNVTIHGRGEASLARALAPQSIN